VLENFGGVEIDSRYSILLILCFDYHYV